MNKELKEKLKMGFVKHRTYITKGMAEIYAFRAIIMFVSAAGLFLEYVVKVKLPVWIYVISGIIMTIACWAIGAYWDKCHLYETEAEFSNNRNPAMRLLKRMSKRKA